MKVKEKQDDCGFEVEESTLIEGGRRVVEKARMENGQGTDVEEDLTRD